MDNLSDSKVTKAQVHTYWPNWSTFKKCVGPRLYVKTDCTLCHLFTSRKHTPFTLFMKPSNVLYLYINDVCEYKLPYMHWPLYAIWVQPRNVNTIETVHAGRTITKTVWQLVGDVPYLLLLKTSVNRFISQPRLNISQYLPCLHGS